MELKEFVKQVMREVKDTSGFMAFDLIVVPKDNRLEVVPSLDSPNVSRIQFTVEQKPKDDLENA